MTEIVQLLVFTPTLVPIVFVKYKNYNFKFMTTNNTALTKVGLGGCGVVSDQVLGVLEDEDRHRQEPRVLE